MLSKAFDNKKNWLFIGTAEAGGPNIDLVTIGLPAQTSQMCLTSCSRSVSMRAMRRSLNDRTAGGEDWKSAIDEIARDNNVDMVARDLPAGLYQLCHNDTKLIVRLPDKIELSRADALEAVREQCIEADAPEPEPAVPAHLQAALQAMLRDGVPYKAAAASLGL